MIKKLLVGCVAVCVLSVLSLFINVGKASASFNTSCINRSGDHQGYANLIVNSRWIDGNGAVHQSNDTKVRVTTVSSTSATKDASGVGLNVVHLGAGPEGVTDRVHSAVFDQIQNFGCHYSPDSGSPSRTHDFDGDYTNVILGDKIAVTSPRDDGVAGPWALDCDELARGFGNGTQFQITGVGTPTGSNGLGSWDSPSVVTSANGDTDFITVTYRDAGPPQVNWELNGGSTVSQGTAAPGQVVTFSHTVLNTSGNMGADSRVNGFTTSLSGNAGSTGALHRGNLLEDHSVDQTYNFTIPAGAANGQVYCQQINFGNPNHETNSVIFNGIRSSDPACVTVVINITPSWLGVGVSCNEISGWAFDPDTPASNLQVDIYVDGPPDPDPTVNASRYLGSTTTGLSSPTINATPFFDSPAPRAGNPGFYVAMPAALQDGLNHSFYVYVHDTDGVTLTGAAAVTLGDTHVDHIAGADPITMVGCGNFTLAPDEGGEFIPDSEDPTQFCSVNPHVTTTFPGRSPDAPALNVPASSPITFTKGGSNIGPSSSVGSSFAAGVTSRNPPPCVPVGTITAGVQFCTALSVTPSSGIIDNNGTILAGATSSATDDSNCATVVNKPTFQSNAGGLSAGGNFPDSGTCSGGGTLGGYTNDIAAPFGSGAGLAAIGLTKIVGVSSGKGSTIQSAGASGASWLNFSNTTPPLTTSTDSPALGGAFGGTHCFTNPAKPDGTPNDLGSTVTLGLPGGLLSGAHAGGSISNLSSGFPGLKAGHNVALYVTGDVYISSNIAYFLPVPWSFSPGSAGSSTVPSFTLVVTGGNIYIAPGVTQLDGIYVAKATNATNGKIYTCGTPVSSFAPMPISSLYTSCNNQLTINGAFVANQVKLMRTYGSLRNDRAGAPGPCANAGIPSTLGTCSAEVFNFSPELYLSNQPIKKQGNGANVFDALTSLPPVL